MSNVTKNQIADKLSVVLKAKPECVSVFGLKTKFGGGRSSGFALIYDSLDDKKKFDSKKSLKRVSIPGGIKRALLKLDWQEKLSISVLARSKSIQFITNLT